MPIAKLLENISEDFTALLGGAEVVIRNDKLKEMQLALEDLEAKRT